MSAPIFLGAMVLLFVLMSGAAFRLFLRRVTT
jgi:hypothetical protein